MTVRVIIKGKQGSGKSTLAAMLQAEGASYSLQDGEATSVHRAGASYREPVSVAIIVKQG